ncbi:MAG: hypothetical protein KA375_12890 [Vitreoscilla sp.]|nr:hypothetical protein [Burkholderiales bacterium]MBP6338487.1 hypothetical protein [Vitreoscilla sp.]
MSAAASSSSNRRLVLLVLVALGLWFFRDSFTTDTPPARKPARTGTAANPSRALRSAPPEDVCTVPTALPQRGVLVAKAKANPFVVPPPPPVKPPKPVKTQPVVVAVAPTVASPASAPLPPPKLPYTYIGQFVDPGRPTTVFLSSGNALLNANPGDTLDGGFKLESIGPRELVFVHVQRNVTLRMPIEGERL